MKPSPPADRWPELDGVRGLAALLVVYAHLFLMWMPAHPGLVFWVRSFSGLAWTGVHLFFVLSGFLIGGILLQHRSSENYFSVFYTRRALRILPLYFILLAGFFLLRIASPLGRTAAFADTEIPHWTYLLLVQNFPMAATGSWGAAPLSVTWSVALEEQFYLLLPLCIRMVPFRLHLPLFAALAASGPLFRALAPLSYSPFLMPGVSEALFTGTILAWAFYHRPQMFRSWRWRCVATALFGLGAAGMALIVTRAGLGVFEVTAMTFFWGGFLWLVLGRMGTGWTAVLRSRVLRGMGAISYGVYLFHALVYAALFALVTGEPPRHAHGGRGLLLALVSFVLVLVVAAMLHSLVERPLIAQGRRLRYLEEPHRPALAGRRDPAPIKLSLPS